MKQNMDYINITISCLSQDFPTDHIDDFKLPFDDTLNKTKRGRDADAYHRSRYEINTVIGHSLGGAVALSLENNIKRRE